MNDYEDDFDLGMRPLENDLLGGDWGESEADAFAYDEDDLAPDDWEDAG
jgi:hypothetical protein